MILEEIAWLNTKKNKKTIRVESDKDEIIVADFIFYKRFEGKFVEVYKKPFIYSNFGYGSISEINCFYQFEKWLRMSNLEEVIIYILNKYNLVNLGGNGYTYDYFNRIMKNVRDKS